MFTLINILSIPNLVPLTLIKKIHDILFGTVPGLILPSFLLQLIVYIFFLLEEWLDTIGHVVTLYMLDILTGTDAINLHLLSASVSWMWVFVWIIDQHQGLNMYIFTSWIIFNILIYIRKLFSQSTRTFYLSAYFIFIPPQHHCQWLLQQILPAQKLTLFLEHSTGYDGFNSSSYHTKKKNPEVWAAGRGFRKFSH